MTQPVTSKDNSQVKELVSLLRYKKQRELLDLFVLEGARLCSDGVKAGIPIVKAFASEKGAKTYSEQWKALQSSAQQTFNITDDLAQWATDTRNPQGLFAVCKRPTQAPSLQAMATQKNILLLENIQDPGNLGTMLRTATAFGFGGCVLTKDSVELFSPKVVRASMGAAFRLPYLQVDNLTKAISQLRKLGLPVFAATLNDSAHTLGTGYFKGYSGLVIGNEGSGLLSETVAACSNSVKIPMSGAAESLNAATAAGILMWELTQGEL